MTKKHFIALAATLRAQYNHIADDLISADEPMDGMQAFDCIYNAIESFCARQNAQFDADRFHAAVFGESK